MVEVKVFAGDSYEVLTIKEGVRASAGEEWVFVYGEENKVLMMVPTARVLYVGIKNEELVPA